VAGSLRVIVVAAGKVKERGLRDTIDDYAKRIGRYARFEEIEIKDGDPEQVEARFRKAIPDRARVVALEIQGDALSSAGLAKLVARAEGEGRGALVFLIGGAYGLPPALSRAADSRLSLGPMTLPHRIARLVLFEQIYRAFTILRREPYDHA
jgi:23S rRNA (pseudouridine1915-N3)-methyltransferase